MRCVWQQSSSLLHSNIFSWRCDEVLAATPQPHFQCWKFGSIQTSSFRRRKTPAPYPMLKLPRVYLNTCVLSLANSLGCFNIGYGVGVFNIGNRIGQCSASMPRSGLGMSLSGLRPPGREMSWSGPSRFVLHWDAQVPRVSAPRELNHEAPLHLQWIGSGSWPEPDSIRQRCTGPS